MGIGRDTVNGSVAYRARDESLAQDLCARMPEMRDAIRTRMAEFPEYREWLEQFGRGVLLAVEEPQGLGTVTTTAR